MSGTSSAISMYSSARTLVISLGGVDKACTPIAGIVGVTDGVGTVASNDVMVVVAAVDVALNVGREANAAAGGTTPIPKCNRENSINIGVPVNGGGLLGPG